MRFFVGVAAVMSLHSNRILTKTVTQQRGNRKSLSLLEGRLRKTHIPTTRQAMQLNQKLRVETYISVLGRPRLRDEELRSTLTTRTFCKKPPPHDCDPSKADVSGSGILLFHWDMGHLADSYWNSGNIRDGWVKLFLFLFFFLCLFTSWGDLLKGVARPWCIYNAKPSAQHEQTSMQIICGNFLWDSDRHAHLIAPLLVEGHRFILKISLSTG